jgi:hypothetical protein
LALFDSLGSATHPPPTTHPPKQLLTLIFKHFQSKDKAILKGQKILGLPDFFEVSLM